MRDHLVHVAISLILLMTAGIGSGAMAAETVQLGPRPIYLVDDMDDGELKRALERCKAGPFRRTAEPLHKGATLYAAAWYAKTRFTFGDAIAAVRLKIWIGHNYSRSTDPPDQRKIPPHRLIRIAHAIGHVA